MPDTKLIEFDIFRTLHVIENNKDLNKIFKGYVPNLNYNMLGTMARAKTLDSEILARAKEIFEGIIVENEKMLKAYTTLIIKKKRKRPIRYYGKEKILQDLKKNGKSEVDSALLSLNGLRNTMSRLRRRCINEKVLNKNILTTSDYRTIVAAVKILESRVKPILKK